MFFIIKSILGWVIKGFWYLWKDREFLKMNFGVFGEYLESIIKWRDLKSYNIFKVKVKVIYVEKCSFLMIL